MSTEGEHWAAAKKEGGEVTSLPRGQTKRTHVTINLIAQTEGGNVKYFTSRCISQGAIGRKGDRGEKKSVVLYIYFSARFVKHIKKMGREGGSGAIERMSI